MANRGQSKWGAFPQLSLDFLVFLVFKNGLKSIFSNEMDNCLAFNKRIALMSFNELACSVGTYFAEAASNYRNAVVNGDPRVIIPAVAVVSAAAVEFGKCFSHLLKETSDLLNQR